MGDEISPSRRMNLIPLFVGTIPRCELDASQHKCLPPYWHQTFGSVQKGSSGLNHKCLGRHMADSVHWSITVQKSSLFIMVNIAFEGKNRDRSWTICPTCATWLWVRIGKKWKVYTSNVATLCPHVSTSGHFSQWP